MGIPQLYDAGLKLRQIETDIIYEDAVDISPCPYTYEETDEAIAEAEIDDSTALAILTDGEVV